MQHLLTYKVRVLGVYEARTAPGAQNGQRADINTNGAILKQLHDPTQGAAAALLCIAAAAAAAVHTDDGTAISAARCANPRP